MNDFSVEQVNDRLYRLPLPLPLEDLHSVNAYVLDSGAAGGLTLIDPGWASGENEQNVRAGLRELGYGVEDITQIAVTHGHWDHSSQAIGWQRKYGATVFMGHEERHTVEALDLDVGFFPIQVKLLEQAGARDLAADFDALPLKEYEKNVPHGAPDVWLQDQQVIDVGGLPLVAHLTPGHTRGHMMFESPKDGVMFTGDHILPRITPSIGFEGVPENAPLGSYLASLQRAVAHPDSRMLPAHGSIGNSVRERAEELLHHHEVRLKEIGDYALSGARTPFEVATQMRWTRRERRLSELAIQHQAVAVLEVLWHLDVLVERGVLARASHRGGNYFLPTT